METDKPVRFTSSVNWSMHRQFSQVLDILVGVEARDSAISRIWKKRDPAFFEKYLEVFNNTSTMGASFRATTISSIEDFSNGPKS